MAGKPKKDRVCFDDKTVKQIETMAGLGMPVDQMAAILGVSKDTFERRMKSDRKVNAAVLKGRAIASSNVRKTAYHMAVSGKSAVMTIFWLKVRERWKEAQTPSDEKDSKGFQLNYSLDKGTQDDIDDGIEDS